MIVWILMNLYHKNLKDLKILYRCIRFKRTLSIVKSIFKITRVSEKNNKK